MLKEKIGAVTLTNERESVIKDKVILSLEKNVKKALVYPENL